MKATDRVPNVRESSTALDSRIQAVDSRFWVLDSVFFQIPIVSSSCIPDSTRKISRIPDSFTWGNTEPYFPVLLLVEEFTLTVASWVIRERWREIRRFALEFKASYFFLNSYVWCFLFKKSNFRVQRNSILNLECKEVRDQSLENLDFPIHFL